MSTYHHDSDPQPSVVRERDLESDFIEKLRGLKYTDRPPILHAKAKHNAFLKDLGSAPLP